MAQVKWSLSLDEVLKVTKGQCAKRIPIEFTGVGTDSRRDLKGQLFVALVGDRFDAHDYLEAAVKAGAAGLMVHRSNADNEKWAERLPVIVVPDTLPAFQSLASYWRRRCRFKVVGISGSNGKTSTKEFAQALLSPHRRCFASKGSFNNHWGVPMTLLSAPPDSEVVLQEMGMNHAGELTKLTEIAEPDVALVTMVGRAHIGELGSQEAVAAAKEELYRACPWAIQIFNLDNEWTINMYERARKALPVQQLRTFSSFREEADIRLRAERIVDFKLEVTGHINGVKGHALVPVLGRQNVVNLMAASAIAISLKLSPEQVWQALPHCRGAWGRNQLVHLPNGAKVIFDGYNANPESMTALLKNLFEFEIQGKKVAVLGEMMELGGESARLHRELGELVGRSGLDVVWFMGPHKADFEAGLKAERFSKTLYISDTYEENLARQVGSVLHPGDIAVVKGSRAMQMEKVVEEWRPVDFSSYAR